MICRFTFILFLLLPTTETLVADDTAGAHLFKACISCHGQNGEGSEKAKAPRLAKQHGWYLALQLTNFKNGSRKGHPSLPTLSDKDKEVLGAYMESQP